MLDKEFDQLSTREKFHLQSLEKRAARGEQIDGDDLAIYDKFHERYAAELQRARSRWPIIVVLVIGAALMILRKLG